MKTNLMLDLETTGVEPGCCILSIALVPFAYDSSLHLSSFYETISHSSSKDFGFTDNPDTLAWWDKQRADVQAEAFSGIRSVDSVMESVAFYIRGFGEPKEINIWGNGKDFDNAILTKCLKHLGIKQPWHYSNNWCYRDFAKQYPMIAKVKPANAHNALSDASAQALHLDAIFHSIRTGLRPVLPTGI